MIYKNGPETLQLDLISTCNALCHFCLRQDTQGHPQSHYPKNVHLDPDLVLKAIQDPAFNNLKEILFCGNFGDALSSPHLVSIIDSITSYNSTLGINIHTNGGLGSQRLWQALAERLQGRGRFIKFSIDGLQDTNHLYRKGVEWKKVLENADTFIKGGGRAIWKFVVFEHNKHQIEEARALSQELGFARFVTVPNYFPEGESRLLATSTQIVGNEIVAYEVAPEERKRKKITCDACERSSVFLDFEGKLWPCCFIAGWKYSSDSAKRTFHQDYFKQVSDAEFNSLHTFSASEILSHPWFSKTLPESWGATSQAPLHYECLSTCGVS